MTSRRALGGQKICCFFPEAEQYRALLQQAGFDVTGGFVRLVQQKRNVPTFEALVGLLRSQPYVGYDTNLPEQNRRGVSGVGRKEGSHRTQARRRFVRLGLRETRLFGIQSVASVPGET